MSAEDRQMKALLAYPPASLQEGWTGALPYIDNMVCLGSYLRYHGSQVTLFHEHPYSIVAFAKAAATQKPDIICLSCDVANFNSCVELTNLARKIIPSAVTVWGGYHATLFDTKILERVPSLDMIIRNEGEETLQEVIDIIGKNRRDPDFGNVLGVTYRKDGQIRKNQNRPPIEDMDTLPFLSYELLDMDKAFNMLSWQPGVYPIHVGRGCSFSCSFCADKGLWARNYRHKSAGRVIEEIKYYCDHYPVSGLAFSDATFTANKAWVGEICELLIRERLDLEWSCMTRVDCVDDGLLALMKRSGCKMVIYGVESFSDVMLKRMKRNYSSALAMDILRQTHALGIDTYFFLQLGFPGETEQTLKELLTKLNELDPEISCNSVSVFRPHPGSDFYDEAKAKGIIDDEMWFKEHDINSFFDAHRPPGLARKIRLCQKAIINRYREKLKERNPKVLL